MFKKKKKKKEEEKKKYVFFTCFLVFKDQIRNIV
jgi:hypothetical protein